jgi:hypothetical protein
VSLWIILTPILLFIAVCCYETVKIEHRARRFFEDVARLKVTASSVEDVLRLLKTTDATRYGFDPCISGGANCVGRIIFENTWLYRLRLAPRTAFGCDLQIGEGRLHIRRLTMVSLKKNLVGGLLDWGVFINESTSTTSKDEITHSPQEKFFRITTTATTETMGVMITPEAPPDLRRSAYVINFGCLSKIGGCKTYEEMLPILARRDLITSDPWFHEFRPN